MQKAFLHGSTYDAVLDIDFYRPFMTILPRKFAFNALYLFVICLAAYVVLCILVSFHFKKKIRGFGSDSRVFIYDSRMGYLPQSNMDAHLVFNGVDFQWCTDKNGFRVSAPGIESPKQPSIMTIGCSFSLGAGVKNEETFTSLLGQRLGLKTVNLAVGGYGTVQSLFRLEKYIHYKPDFILYGFIDSHIKRSLRPCMDNPLPFCTEVPIILRDKTGNYSIKYPAKSDSPDMIFSFILEVIQKDFNLDYVFWGHRLILHMIKNFGRNQGHNSPEDRAAAMNLLLGRMNELAEKAGARLVVLHLPYLKKGRTNPPPAELLDALPDGILFIDLSVDVARHYKSSKKNLSFENDYHPNALAHGIFAKKILEVLSSAGGVRNKTRTK